MDGIDDCPHSDDEDIIRINNNNNVIKQSHYKCQTSNKYIPRSSIANGECDCGEIEPNWCEDENLDMNYIRRNISFQTICDGYTELSPRLIDGQNQTDETECERWSCNNIYTYCNGIWNCANGEDEVGCYLLSPLNCSSDEHICVSPHTNKLTCLSINKANDGHIDCLGATDEQNLCYKNNEINHSDNFYCMNDSNTLCIKNEELCNSIKKCNHGDDEQFCVTKELPMGFGGICYISNLSKRSDVEKFLCETSKEKTKQQILYFSLDRIENSVKNDEVKDKYTKYPILLLGEISQQELQLCCHRGLDLRIWLNDEINSTKTTCLCPPSFYGSQCQNQNQRVSLSIQFRASSHSWQIPFAIIISLIDDDGDQRIIHSYEQFTYLSIRDCQMKFNIYLLYSTRPKNETKSYSIHVDIYEKVTLNYRGTFIIDIPRDNKTIESCSNHQCNNGKCIKYFNNLQNTTFCQCNRGWSGRSCTIPHRSNCSSDSLSIGVTTNDRSVCVCSLHRFGPRCLIINSVCQINPCKNGGQCIPNDEYIESDQKFKCICPNGFIGDRCEITENKIILSFGNDIILSQSIFIHFIEVLNNDKPRRTTTLRTIPFKKDSIIIQWSQPFHLVFIEFSKDNYYLTIVEKNYNKSAEIIKSINSSDRCRNITEIFNETIVKLDLIRRIKYYHLPCHNLSCFYDDIHLCLCQYHEKQRVANCFEFNHNMTFNCLGQSVCENNAQCFQDKPNCPQRSICICSSCFYGATCQFSTSGFGLSLDAILGYHIQPDVKMIQQPIIVQISVVLTMLFILVGLVNGILSMITFQNRSVRDVGCGLYLFCSSISTLLTTIMFGLKFWILIVAQMGLIRNKSLLLFQCHSFDFLLRTGVIMDQWLNACVAIERATTVIQGTRFDKKKSKKLAKLVIIILLILTIGTGLDDPIFRRLIDEENEDEKRIWCIVSYSSGLQKYNSIMNTFHFIAPFIFNLISAIILIKRKSRQKLTIQTDRAYDQLLREQIREHKNLFIAPVILVILALPRIIISFVSKCMKSTSDSWFFLCGYFISFIPPMLTFVVFILPSKFYKEEFSKSIARYQTNIRQRLHAIS